ncbi:hypothetical protein R5R73_13875 [Salinicola sp. LHM]|uniref:hypothetical protein n=1 Tax=Salinicola sp. LHM TaxID=3065298 RepID=UPI002ACD8C19|nr:hypothetical protein [Salinicola sp. LHM]WQH32120.1 hypothetical protein R5R73_13875 [Salinicola sp. LHM]
MRPDNAPHGQSVPTEPHPSYPQPGGLAAAQANADATADTMTQEPTRMTTPTENTQDTQTNAQPTGEQHAMTQADANTHETDTQAQPPIRPRLTGQSLNFVPETNAISALTPERARKRIEQARTEYLAQRERLEPAAQELERLRKIRSAAEHQSRQSGESWRKGFLENFGKQGKTIRDQQKAEREWRLEAEQTDAMIELLAPQVEWLRLHTQVAREEFQRTRKAAREVLSQQTLLAAAEALCQSEAAGAFYAALPALFDRVATDLCNNASYMAHHFQVDTSAEPGTAIKRSLNNQETQHLDHEIRKRQYAAIGEMVWRLRPDNLDAAQPETLADIAPLGCEDGRNVYGSSIKRAQRLKELQAQLELPAH